MIRFAILITIVAGVFSFLAFQQGGALPGVILAIAALVPLVVFIVSMARSRHVGGQPTPWNSAAKATLSVVSVLLLAGVAYSAYWFVFTPKAQKDLKHTSAFETACTKPPKYFPSAAKHEGSGPHPIAVFYDRGGSSSLNQFRFDYKSSAEWTTTNAEQVQLVACFSDFDRATQVGECKFTNGTAPLFTGTYKGSVFEAHTRKKVGEVEVAANPTASERRDCPTMIYIKGEVNDQEFHTQPDPTELQRVLGPFVNS